MNCKDQSLKYLKDFGYNVVRLPRADISPLQLFMKKGGSLEPLGPIESLLVAGTSIPLPTVKQDVPTTNLSGKRTGNLDISVGLDILGNIIGAMGGGKIGLDLVYKNAKSLVFEFQDVLSDSVNIIDLDKFLTDAGADPFANYIKKLLESDEIYVITSIIKSKKIKVEGVKSDNTSLDLDASAIQEILGPKIKVGKESTSQNTIGFSGDTNLTFGFKAARLIYKKGKYVSFELVSDGGVAASLTGRTEPDQTKYLLSNELVDYQPKQ